MFIALRARIPKFSDFSEGDQKIFREFPKHSFFLQSCPPPLKSPVSTPECAHCEIGEFLSRFVMYLVP